MTCTNIEQERDTWRRQALYETEVAAAAQDRIKELESQLEAVGAGGVSPIMGCQRCRQLQGVLQAVLDDKVTVLSRGVYDQIREALA